jgi:hypothetical protein
MYENFLGNSEEKSLGKPRHGYEDISALCQKKYGVSVCSIFIWLRMRFYKVLL